MRQELDDKLCRDFPLLYRRRHKPMQETCMCWGFNVGDGWFDLIYDLSAKLEKIIQRMKNEGTPEDELPAASQVKEKYGTLRFYTDFGTDEMYELIDEAEDLSCHTCEVCGEPGQVSGSGWVAIRCEEHEE